MVKNYPWRFLHRPFTRPTSGPADVAARGHMVVARDVMLPASGVDPAHGAPTARGTIAAAAWGTCCHFTGTLS